MNVQRAPPWDVRTVPHRHPKHEHPLQRTKLRGSQTCGLCEVELNRGDWVQHCRACGYDLCEACVNVSNDGLCDRLTAQPTSLPDEHDRVAQLEDGKWTGAGETFKKSSSSRRAKRKEWLEGLTRTGTPEQKLWARFACVVENYETGEISEEEILELRAILAGLRDLHPEPHVSVLSLRSTLLCAESVKRNRRRGWIPCWSGAAEGAPASLHRSGPRAGWRKGTRSTAHGEARRLWRRTSRPKRFVQVRATPVMSPM